MRRIPGFSVDGKTRADATKAWLNTAIQDGIVDVDSGIGFDPNFPTELMARARVAFDKGPNKTARAYELATDAKSRRHNESRMDPITQPNTAEYWLVELARVYVSFGEIGFVNSLEQVLWDVNGNYYPSSNAYWGNPYSVIPDVSQCRWYLTYDTFGAVNANPGRFQVSQAAPIPISRIPGAPYPELFEIDGMWYPAHASASNKLKWLISQDRVLRFFFLSAPTTQYQWRVSGRIRANIQSTFSREAAKNAREIY